MEKSKGGKQDLCGIPAIISLIVDLELFSIIYNVMFSKKEFLLEGLDFGLNYLV